MPFVCPSGRIVRVCSPHRVPLIANSVRIAVGLGTRLFSFAETPFVDINVKKFGCNGYCLHQADFCEFLRKEV